MTKATYFVTCKMCTIRLPYNQTNDMMCAACWAKFKAVAKSLKEAKANTPSKTQAKVMSQGVMKKGDIKKIPAGFGCENWAFQGSGKIPYIVTHKKNSASSAAYEWQCSCPAWTTTTPREDCKHILKIKLAEGVTIPNIVAPSLPSTSAGEGALVRKEGRKFR